jgi:hypothetical protein
VLGKSQASCRLCGRALVPEETYKVVVPFLDRSFETCRDCRDDWNAGGRALLPFEPAFRGDRTHRWAGPIASDARVLLARALEELGAPAGTATLATIREAIAAGTVTELDLARGLALAIDTREELAPIETLERTVDRKARTESVPLLFGFYAHALAGPPLTGTAAPRVTPEKKKLLEVARSAYLQFLPFTLKTELDGRIAALHATVSLELGDSATAEQKLLAFRTQAQARAPEARDPRLPFQQALVFLRAGHVAAVDEAFATSVAWCRAAKDPSAWTEIEALCLRASYVRAVENGRFAQARDAMKAYVKLRPDDRRALMDLAHAYAKCDMDPVAREVFARYHAQDPKDEDGLILYATCLQRLGETEQAWRLLRDDLETEREVERLGAERRHLAALCAHAVGQNARALELATAAWELAPADDRVRRNLVTILLEELEERLANLSPEQLPELLEVLSKYRAAFDREYGAAALELLGAFISREIASGFAGSSSFGFDDLGKLRFVQTEGTLLQALVFLAQRKLPDAVAKDREARAVGAPPIPFRLLLTLLDRIKSQRDEWKGVLGGS